MKLNEVTADVAGLKGNFQQMGIKYDGLEAKFDSLESKLSLRMDSFESRIELKISEAINKNMRWSIGLNALIVTALKLADMFVK